MPPQQAHEYVTIHLMFSNIVSQSCDNRLVEALTLLAHLQVIHLTV